MEGCRNEPRIDVKNARFPFCVVWTPLPVIAWLVPFVGHMGICREDGVILDFAGSYFICVDNFTFGRTSRYVKLNPNDATLDIPALNGTCRLPALCQELETPSSWDDGIRLAIRQFQNISYNIFTSNCHSFVARFLNTVKYKGRDNWNMVDLVLMIVFEGKWVSFGSAVTAFLPSIIIAVLGCSFLGSSFFLLWAGFVCLLISWFLLGTYVWRGLLTT